MTDKVKLIIEMPIRDYEWLKKFAKGNTFIPVYDALAKAFLNGVPLDDVKQEIWTTDFDFGDYYDHTAEIQDKVCEILDNIGKESEENGYDLD